MSKPDESRFKEELIGLDRTIDVDPSRVVRQLVARRQAWSHGKSYGIRAGVAALMIAVLCTWFFSSPNSTDSRLAEQANDPVTVARATDGVKEPAASIAPMNGQGDVQELKQLQAELVELTEQLKQANSIADRQERSLLMEKLSRSEIELPANFSTDFNRYLGGAQ